MLSSSLVSGLIGKGWTNLLVNKAKVNREVIFTAIRIKSILFPQTLSRLFKERKIITRDRITKSVFWSIGIVVGLWLIIGQFLYSTLSAVAMNSAKELNIVTKFLLMFGDLLRVNIVAILFLIIYMWGVLFSVLITIDHVRKNVKEFVYKAGIYLLLTFFHLSIAFLLAWGIFMR